MTIAAVRTNWLVRAVSSVRSDSMMTVPIVSCLNAIGRETDSAPRGLPTRS